MDRSNNLSEAKLNIDVTDYWIIIRKRYFHIILVFLLAITITYLYTDSLSPVYQSACTIQIAARQPMATIEGAQINWYGAKGNEISSEIKLIGNKDELLDRVASIIRYPKRFGESKPDYFSSEDLRYIKHLHFSPENMKLIKTINSGYLHNHIDVQPVSGSNLVTIYFEGPYQNVAIAVANITAMVYRADFIATKTNEARETQEFIAKELKKITTNLDKINNQIENTSAENAFLGSETVYREQLAELQIELDKYKERYTAAHPRVEKQKKLIASIEKQLLKVPVANQKYDEKVTRLEELQALRKVLGELSLKAGIDFEAKKEKAKDEIKIISMAKSAHKLRPNKPMNMIVGAMFGLILGCMSAFVWEGLDTSIGKIEDVERITGLPVIAHIPLIGQKETTNTFFRPVRAIYTSFKGWLNNIPFFQQEEPRDFDRNLIFNLTPMSVAAEAYRTLRTNIHFAIGSPETTGHVIAITSTSPREGKTLTSTNLAIEVAQMGKAVLLIEGDTRRPQIADMFKIDETPGLCDVLMGTAERSEATRTITDILMGDSEWDKLMELQGIDNLHILPCGSIQPNPTELLLSRDFKDLIAKAREGYDFVIIDTPPTLPVSDSSIISTVVDGTVLIYQSDKTSRHLLLRAIQTLQKNRANLLGIVINQLSFDVILQSSRSKYAYAYTYGYGGGRNTGRKSSSESS